jgi:hypothetical protein
MGELCPKFMTIADVPKKRRIAVPDISDRYSLQCNRMLITADPYKCPSSLIARVLDISSAI